mmetsp:Transcript_36831/g.92991  ORF Transcript_36831/g.92991 Transcript_36831/m.92991 type:complete len:203 (+) Transcript_36831:754-1362(+)
MRSAGGTATSPVVERDTAPAAPAPPPAAPLALVLASTGGGVCTDCCRCTSAATAPLVLVAGGCPSFGAAAELLPDSPPADSAGPGCPPVLPDCAGGSAAVAALLPLLPAVASAWCMATNFSTQDTFSCSPPMAGPTTSPQKGAPMEKRSTKRARTLPGLDPAARDDGGVMGCTVRNAPTAPRKPSCLKNMAAMSPLDQNLMA